MARTETSGNKSTRSETDSFGPIDVPADRYWGAQTERSRQNFKIGQDRMPIAIVHARSVADADRAAKRLREAVTVSDEPSAGSGPPILRRMAR